MTIARTAPAPAVGPAVPAVPWTSRAAALMVVAALVVGGWAAPVRAEGPGVVPTPIITDAPDTWPRPIGTDVAAYLLLDLATGQVLAARDADERRPVASTVKVLTALTAVRRAALDEEVTVGDEVLGVTGSGVGLEPGDVWTVEELLDAIIARSGNEAAEALAVHVAGSRDAFLRMMEADAAELGVPGLELVSVSGLDDGNLISATDLAWLSAVALADAELGPILARSSVTLPGQEALPTRNDLLVRYGGATGVKTGFTTAAGYSLVGSARRDGRDLVAVVLGAGEDPARFDLATRLLDLGYSSYEPRSLSADVRFAVAGGQVRLSVDGVEVVVPTGEPASLSLPIAPRPPEADVTVPLLVGGREVAQLPGLVDRSRVPAPAEDTATAIGRAAVDGTYAALRPWAATSELG